MDAISLNKNIGKEGTLRFGKLGFRVRIVNCRELFGRLEYEVEPANGWGMKWVTAEKVEVK